MGYEYVVVALAAVLAGIGTGLVGLSAATAMVPLLIVLCPTFGGEHGAYMATAIALASDILGSAVTTCVYAKNKKIDLKHGWLMAMCIIGMCTVGSIAAYFTHQNVLGGFSLLLCVAIGIRFLVSPDSKERPEKDGKVKLTAKEIAVSLFFGLTIGFGTGFFGTGGGMMMLIVFTAMLGYDRKTAVGTSTFIMTFTALIASVSHILIEPTILFECWDFLLIAIAAATFFSLVSARFANKVKGKVVGYVTGAILLALGIAMIFLQNLDKLDTVLLREYWKVLGIYTGYIVAFASILIAVRFTTRVPDYIFRKLLHCVAFTSILPLVLFTDIWWIADAVEVLFLILVLGALHIFEHFLFYKKLFVEKGKHEVIFSFIGLFGLMTVLIAIFWGIFGREHLYIAIGAIMAWGPGDAVAAIVGKKMGKHKLSGKYIEGTKSVEGSIGMAITAFVCLLPVLLFMSALPWYVSVLFALVIAPCASLTELFTRGGWDTVTVPVVVSLILCLSMLWG
ncbi:MAG: TSUP family transporter [Oscillospiraceae bacterium]|nr:TSUP family transporter [Oscillospiraceae bacterium]